MPSSLSKLVDGLFEEIHKINVNVDIIINAKNAKSNTKIGSAILNMQSLMIAF